MKRRLIFLCCLLCLLAGIGQADKSATLMLYISGYDLEQAACLEIQDLMQGNYADDFNICVWAGGTKQWRGMFELADEELNQLVIGNGEFIEKRSAGRMSVADPETLASFIVSSVHEYPAERYFLMLYDHGAGPAGGMLFDSVFRDDLGMIELRSAFREVQEQLGDFHFDMISIHACLMGTVEVLAACQGMTDCVVCSEEMILSDSLRNSVILSALREDPACPTETLAQKLVDSYLQETGEGNQLAAYNMNRIEPMLESLNLLLENTASQMDATMFRDLSRARATMRDLSASSQETAAAEEFLWDTVDLKAFLGAIDSIDPEQTGRILEQFDDALISSVPGRDTELCGLGILFPNDLLRDNFETRYDRYFTGQLPGLEQFVHRYCALKDGREKADDSGNARPEPGQENDTASGISSLIITGSQDTTDGGSAGTSSLITMGDTEAPDSDGTGTSSLITMGGESPSEEAGTSSLIASGEESGNPSGSAQADAETQEPLFDLKTPNGTSERKAEGNRTYSLQLDETMLEELASAEGILTVTTEVDGKNVYTDITDSLETSVDWESGQISAVFDGNWIRIDGQIAVVIGMEENSGVTYMTVPAVLNGENVILEYLFRPGQDQGKLTRVMDSGGNEGYRALSVMELGDSDTVSLRYWSYMYVEGQTEMFERFSEPISPAQCRVAERKPIVEESYLSFCLNDIYGDTTYSAAMPLQ